MLKIHTFIRSVLLATTIAALVSGCSERIEPQPNTYTHLLTGTTSKTWRLVSAQVIDDGNASGVIPVSNFLDPCEADDQYIFFANEERKFEFRDGSVKCSQNDPDLLFTSSWSINTANATIEMPVPPFYGADLYPFTIKRLTETSMTVELYYEKLTSDNLNVSYQFTFNSSSK